MTTLAVRTPGATFSITSSHLGVGGARAVFGFVTGGLAAGVAFTGIVFSGFFVAVDEDAGLDLLALRMEVGNFGVPVGMEVGVDSGVISWIRGEWVEVEDEEEALGFQYAGTKTLRGVSGPLDLIFGVAISRPSTSPLFSSTRSKASSVMKVL